MCHKTIRYAVLLGCASLAVAAVAQELPATAPQGGPRLELSEQEWNFGEVWQGRAITHEVTVRNVGDAPLEFLDVKSSCGCTVISKPKSPLAPGESDTLTISYDAKKRVGPARQSFTMTTNDSVRPNAALQIVGTVKAAYEIEPKEGLVFGQLFRSSQVAKTVRITNKYSEKMHLEITAGAGAGPYRLELKETEPGTRWDLVATSEPPLPVGRFSTTVVLSTGVEQIPELGTLVYGFVQAPVAVRPAKLFWPKNAVAEIKRTLWVSHAPDHPLEITAVRATDESIKVELGATTRSATQGEKLTEYQIVVTLPPGDRISADAQPQIEITTTSPDSEYQKLIVPVQIIAAPRGIVSESPQTATRPAPTSPDDVPTTQGALRGGEKP